MFFTLAYASPEVIATFEAGHATHTMRPAADVWALGVIAFEMLTGESVFNPYSGKDAVLNAIAGRGQLPWEGPRRSELLAGLHAFEPCVMACLQRDPAARPSVGTVLEAWVQLVQSSGTI
jgi:serine/threonine protein kinase